MVLQWIATHLRRVRVAYLFIYNEIPKTIVETLECTHVKITDPSSFPFAVDLRRGFALRVFQFFFFIVILEMDVPGVRLVESERHELLYKRNSINIVITPAQLSRELNVVQAVDDNPNAEPCQHRGCREGRAQVGLVDRISFFIRRSLGCDFLICIQPSLLCFQIECGIWKPFPITMPPTLFIPSPGGPLKWRLSSCGHTNGARDVRIWLLIDGLAGCDVRARQPTGARAGIYCGMASFFQGLFVFVDLLRVRIL